MILSRNLDEFCGVLHRLYLSNNKDLLRYILKLQCHCLLRCFVPLARFAKCSHGVPKMVQKI